MVQVRGVMRSPQSLGLAVAEIRRLRGLSQREAAAQLRVSQRYLSELELGRPKIFDERLFQVLGKLGLVLSFDADVPEAERDETVAPSRERRASPPRGAASGAARSHHRE
ncbi:hypothetical protein BH11ACT3_BH11ACT3_06420 [soil metagenome]